MNTFTIRKPDNPHGHLRLGFMMQRVLPFADRIFSRYVVMGNTFPRLIETGEDVDVYRRNIMACAMPGFCPVMSIMLTERTTSEILREAYDAGARYVKFIGKGVSTNSDEGISFFGLKKKYPVLREVEKICLDTKKEDMIFSVHPELNENSKGERIPYIYREEASLPFCRQLVEDFPGLKIIFEHLSTREMIEFVKSPPPNVAGTLTPMSAIVAYEEVCNEAGEVINPLKFFKPVAKRIDDMIAVRETMVSGNPKFFVIPDSAPHEMHKKQLHLLKGKKPAAGVFSDPVFMPLVTDIFFSEISDSELARQRLEDATSRFWAEFMRLPLNIETITLKREEWTVPFEYGGIPIFMGGQTLNWQVV